MHKTYRRGDWDPETYRLGLNRCSRPCPRCQAPFTQAEAVCGACRTAFLQEQCSDYVPGETRWTARDSILMIYGVWRCEVRCRTCSNLCAWRANTRIHYDPQAVRVACTKGRLVLDLQVAPDYLQDGSPIPEALFTTEN